MSKAVKYLRVGGDANNPKDYENCNSVGDCQRHVHVEKIKAFADEMRKLSNNPAQVMSIIEEGGITAEAFETYITKNNTPPMVQMQAKVKSTGAVEDMIVIDSQLTNESRPAQQNALVRIAREEARYMDMDKKTAALGYAIMGNGFKWGQHMLTYELYADSPEYFIYKVDIES